MTPMDILDRIWRKLSGGVEGLDIEHVSLDGTSDDCEIILTTTNGGQRQDWVIRATEVEDDNEAK